MKHLFLAAVFTLLGQQIFSQGCNELFISEYVEGWSNNKAIELYNPTANPINLSAYRLERYSNGSNSAAANQKTDLSGTIEPFSTYVIVIDKRNPDGIEQEAPVWDELQDAADVFINPVYDENNTMYFNGNDAMVLRKINGNVVLDVFGRIGQDPGDPNSGGGWNDVAPYYAWSLNAAIAWSANHTLIRKSDVTQGYITPTQPFNTGAQWDSLPANTFDNLGFHVCLCNPNSISENPSAISLTVFPNPSKGALNLTAPLPIEAVEIMDLKGQLVHSTKPNTNAVTIYSELAPGVYSLKAHTAHGTLTHRIIIE